MASQQNEIKQEIESKMSRDAVLLTACSDGDLKAARDALLAGADINAVGSLLRTPLMLAVIGGHKQVITLLLTQPKIDVHKIEQDGASALSLSLNGWYSQPNYNIARLLIQAGAKIDQVSFSSTLLLTAWYKGTQEAARALIKLGADIEFNERLFRTDLYANQRHGFSGVRGQIELSKKYVQESLEHAKAVGWDIGQQCLELPEDAVIHTAETLFGTNRHGSSLPAREFRNCMHGYELYKRSRQKDRGIWEAWKARYDLDHPNDERDGYGPGALIVRPAK